MPESTTATAETSATTVAPQSEPQRPQNQESLNTSIPTRPDTVPEKFWNMEKGEINTEALLKSYTELEKSKSKEVETPKKEEAKTEETKVEAETKSDSPFTEFYNEYAEKGELAAESYDKLAKLGITKEHVDQYIAGHTANQASVDSSIYEVAGGEDNWKVINQWATSGGLTEAETNYFNSVVDSGNVDAVKFAVTGLKAKFDAAKGKEAKLIDATAPNTADIYADDEEINSDMRDPRYKTDPTFRKKVTQKLSRTLQYRGV